MYTCIGLDHNVQTYIICVRLSKSWACEWHFRLKGHPQFEFNVQTYKGGIILEAFSKSLGQSSDNVTSQSHTDHITVLGDDLCGRRDALINWKGELIKYWTDLLTRYSHIQDIKCDNDRISIDLI